MVTVVPGRVRERSCASGHRSACPIAHAQVGTRCDQRKRASAHWRLAMTTHAQVRAWPRHARRSPMLMMILKRLLIAVPSLIGVVIVTFLLTRALPGDPAAYFAGPAATKEAIEQIRVKLGLDKPLLVQFVRYVADLAHGDLGNSLTTGQPVGQRDQDAAAGLGRADAARPDRLDADRGAARHPRGDAARLADRSRLPRDRDRGRVAAGVLHRADPGLRLLLPARLGAGAARAARRLLQPAAAGHRLLPDRQPASPATASCSRRASSS